MKMMFGLLAIAAAAAGVLAGGPKAAVTPEQALKLLMDGNARYVTSHLTHPDQTAARRRQVVSGQHPFAIVLGCADSRVPPEVIFDQGLGDVFVVRVAGHVTAPEVLGSIEYAVEHLSTPLVMVLGHEKCGAIQAAAAGGHLGGHVAAIAHDLEPALKEAKGQPGDFVHNAVVCNVKNSVRAIESATPLLKDLAKRGKLKVIGADYDLVSGRVVLVP